MSIRPISEAKCPDLRGSVAAMQRAAELREEATNNAGTRTTE